MATARRWSIPFDVIAKRQKQSIQDVISGATLLLFGRVLERSPVDEGTFRANWNPSYGTPDASTTNSVDASSAASDSKSKVSAAVLSYPVGGIVYLCNSLPYALPLEYGLYPNPPKYGSKKRGEDRVAIHVQGGYSMQAPQGMVRITALEFHDAIMKSIQQQRASA